MDALEPKGLAFLSEEFGNKSLADNEAKLETVLLELLSNTASSQLVTGQ